MQMKSSELNVKIDIHLFIIIKSYKNNIDFSFFKVDSNECLLDHQCRQSFLFINKMEIPKKSVRVHENSKSELVFFLNCSFIFNKNRL